MKTRGSDWGARHTRNIRQNRRGVGMGVFIVIVVALLAATIAIGAVVNYVVYYPKLNYPADTAWDFLDLANATSDPHQIAHLLNESAAAIANLHGNPQWLNPTPNTNFDIIRQNMLDTATGILNQTASVGSFAYVQAINSAHQACHALQDRLNEAEKYADFSFATEQGRFQIYYSLGAVVAWVVAILLVRIVVSWNDRRRRESKWD